MVYLPKSLLPCRLRIEAKIDICSIFVASCFMTHLKYPATHFLLLFFWLVKAPMTWKALFPYQASLSLCPFSFCATHLSHANVCNQNLDILTNIAVWILHRSDSLLVTRGELTLICTKNELKTGLIQPTSQSSHLHGYHLMYLSVFVSNFYTLFWKKEVRLPTSPLESLSHQYFDIH